MGKMQKELAKSGRPDMANYKATKLAVVSRQDAASYINDMALEMKVLAESAKLSFLVYLLELVVEESGTHKRGRL